MSATKASWGKMDNIKERFAAVIAALSNDCHVSSNQGKAKLIQVGSFCRRYVQWFAERWCAVDLPSLCVCRDRDPGGTLEELTSQTIFHFPFCLQCKASILKYAVGMKTEKVRFIIYITRLDSMLNPWPGCVTQSQPNSRWSQDPGIPQPFTEGFHRKESWELGLTYACSSRCSFWA